MVDRDVIGNGVVASVDLTTYCAHEARAHLLDVLLVATPT